MTVLALIQCDVTTGDPAGNAHKLAEAAVSSGAPLCIAPLESLAGPHAGCNMRQPDFMAASQTILGQLAADLRDGPALICGTADARPVLLEKGRITPLQDSYRWQGLRIALDLETIDADIALNLHCRPYTSSIQGDWELVLSGLARQLGCICVSVNLVGGCGQYIYNGQSMAMDETGQVIARAKAFAPDCLLLTLNGKASNRIEPLCASKEETQWQALTLGLRDFVHKAGAHTAIIGLSGGMDSALVAAIARDALGADNILGVLMPSPYSSQGSIDDALELAQNLAIKTTTIPITPMFSCFLESLAPAFAQLTPVKGDLAEENLQARIRGVILMALANKSGALVLNTSNKSEAAMGYSTLYGDTVGAVAVIGDLFKTQVYALGRYFNGRERKAIIPENIFQKEPSAELAPNQKDTDSLPPYAELDGNLIKIFSLSQEVTVNPSLQALRKRVQANSFKRRLCPPSLLISSLHPCDGVERD